VGIGWQLCGLFDFDDARLGFREFDLAAGTFEKRCPGRGGCSCDKHPARLERVEVRPRRCLRFGRGQWRDPDWLPRR
jgi:hypothetical protein